MEAAATWCADLVEVDEATGNLKPGARSELKKENYLNTVYLPGS